MKRGFPGGLSGKESACQCRRRRFDPWSGKTLHATGQLTPAPQLLNLCCGAWIPRDCWAYTLQLLKPACYRAGTPHQGRPPPCETRAVQLESSPPPPPQLGGPVCSYRVLGNAPVSPSQSSLTAQSEQWATRARRADKQQSWVPFHSAAKVRMPFTAPVLTERQSVEEGATEHLREEGTRGSLPGAGAGWAQAFGGETSEGRSWGWERQGQLEPDMGDMVLEGGEARVEEALRGQEIPNALGQPGPEAPPARMKMLCACAVQ